MNETDRVITAEAISPRLAQRFWRYANAQADENACWLWSGVTNLRGGSPILEEKTPEGKRLVWSAARIAYLLRYGELRAGDKLQRRCGVFLCCNPTHLLIREPARIEEAHERRQMARRGRYCRHRDKELARSRAWYHQHKNGQDAEDAEEHKQRHAAHSRAWRAAHPEQARAGYRRYNARRASPERLTVQEATRQYRTSPERIAQREALRERRAALCAEAGLPETAWPRLYQRLYQRNRRERLRKQSTDDGAE